MSKNRPRSPRDPLILELTAWIAAKGRISHGYKRDPDDPSVWLHGYQSGSTIYVNPIDETLDSLIHEILHVLKPHWTELGVRRKTASLLGALSDEEKRTLWTIYEDRLTRDKRRKPRPTRLPPTSDSPPGTNGGGEGV